MTDGTLFRQALEYGHRADPYPLFARLREHPVSLQDDGTYVVSTYAELVSLLQDPRLSNDERKGIGRLGPPVYDADGSPPFLLLDPPEHDRLRRLAMRHFGPPHAPDHVQGMRSRVVALVDSFIDKQRGKRCMDVVAEVSSPLPVTLIGELLGVPREDEERFRGWSDALAGTLDPVTQEDPEGELRMAVAHLDLAFYMNELLAERRDHPRDDMLSRMVNDDGPEGRMSQSELIQSSILLLVAGHETTVNLISNGMLTLLRHPEVLEQVRQTPALMLPTVEELLRFEPPVQFRARNTLTDLPIGGTVIPKGAPVILLLASGNRDPGRFETPDRFWPQRPNSGCSRGQHLGFGLGIHHCFGAPMARLEGHIALGEMVRRLVNPRLVADPPPYRTNPALRGPSQLLVEFEDILD